MIERPGLKLLRALVLGAIFCSGVFVVQASEIFSSAEMLEAGSGAVSVFGQVIETKPVVELSGVSAISVPLSGGGSSTIFSSSEAELEMEQRLSQVVASFEIRPREGLRYKFKAGQVREFDLEFSSGSQTNKLQSSNDGYVWGVGLAGRIAPGSMVSTAICWEVAYTQTNIDIDRFEGGPVVLPIDQNWRQEEVQGSMNFSRRWKMLEPFAGLKLARVMNRLKDKGSKAIVRGSNETIAPFVGLAWAVTDKESLVVEVSFVDEESITAGFKVQF